jgi:hypothetical protein
MGETVQGGSVPIDKGSELSFKLFDLFLERNDEAIPILKFQLVIPEPILQDLSIRVFNVNYLHLVLFRVFPESLELFCLPIYQLF